MNTMKKTALVTGGAGFLGSHLCEELLKNSFHVICLDNLLTGTIKNIESLSDCQGFTFIRHDVTEPYDIPADFMFNLACPASPPRYQADPIQTARTNVAGALNILENAARYNARVLQASTSEVYGNPQVHPQTETYYGNVNPVGVRACYDEGKRMAETLFMDYHRTRGTDIRIVRIFNTYGPRMQAEDGRVISNFITQALSGNDITIYGDGTQTRSFCYVDDLIRGITGFMDCESGETGPINLGNPEEISMQELAEAVLRVTASKSEIRYCTLPEDDPVKRKPDISLAGKLFGWQPEVSLDEGIRRIIKYYKEI